MNYFRNSFNSSVTTAFFGICSFWQIDECRPLPITGYISRHIFFVEQFSYRIDMILIYILEEVNGYFILSRSLSILHCFHGEYDPFFVIGGPISPSIGVKSVGCNVCSQNSYSIYSLHLIKFCAVSNNIRPFLFSSI